MASQYIKIFNDTVLKQSILQGYESQRQNPNLGKFTSGELAFTRDTGRVFIGNYTDNPTDNDLKTVNGGILLGNKYLGIIDSRPIAYEQDQTSGSTGLIGLSYEQDNKSEAALFTTNHRVKKESKTNDWNNDPSFNSTYGTYNGDYIFDVWRNALIIFDNRIKPNNNEINVSNPFTKDEKVYDKLNNDITETGSIRTPLYDISNNLMKDYPVYGNGYVIFRIIEPDGKTIKFKEREITSKNQDGKDIGNWTHNIIEVVFDADNLKNSFDEETFAVNNEKFHIKNLNLPTNSSVQLPYNVTFNSYTGFNINYDFVTDLENTLKVPHSESDTFFLCYSCEQTKDDDTGEIKKAKVSFKQLDISKFNELVGDEIAKHDQTITISTTGNLRVNGSDTSTSTNFTLSIVEDEPVVSSTGGVSDPWSCNSIGFYLGTGKFENGQLEVVHDYAPKFYTSQYEDDQGNNITEEASVKETKFDNTLQQFIAYDKYVSNKEITETSPSGETITYTKKYWNCNVGLNYLKTPARLSSSVTSKTKIEYENIGTLVASDGQVIESDTGYRLIPDHAESIIVQIETGSTSATAQVEITGCGRPIFKTSQTNFITTVEIPLIPYTVAEANLPPTIDGDNTDTESDFDGTTITIQKGFSFSIINCSAYLLGYRL